MENEFNFKKIFGNSMWQIGEKIATMVISVVVSALIARYLGVEQFGLANYVISVVALFTTFSTLGMEKITIKDIVDNKDDKSSVLGTSFIIRIIGGIILIIISQITLYILNGANKLYQILGAIMGSCMIVKAFEVIEYYLQAQMKLKVVSIIRFITAIVVAIARIIVIVFNLGVIGFVVSYLIDAIVAGVLFYIYYKSRNKGKWKYDKKYAKSLLSRCWYIAISGLMTTIYMRIDQVMLGSMLTGTTENGIYSAAARIAEMWYFVPMAIIASFQPVIMECKKNNKEEEYNKNIQRLYDIVSIIGVTFGVLVSLFGWIAVYILYGIEYSKASQVLTISVWAGLFATLGSARSIWLISENLQKYTLVYTTTGAVVNLILNTLLIPKIGAFGAATATLVAQFVANVFALMPFKDTKKSSLMILKSIFYNQTLVDAIKYVNQKHKIVKNQGE